MRAFFQCCCGVGVFVEDTGQGVLYDCPDIDCRRTWLVSPLRREQPTMEQATRNAAKFCTEGLGNEPDEAEPGFNPL